MNDDEAGATQLSVNGEARRVASDPATPLLYVLADELDLKGPRFGCGMAQCGSCSVLIDGREVRSCVVPLASALGKDVVTAEGIARWYSPDSTLHPLQDELIAAQAPQCGFCYGGMVVKAAELLAANPAPSRAQIVAHMDGHICRCGTYPRLLTAIERAAARMRGETA
ncbi:(2Fe-2S)-binding protein [Alteraurantiacibacter palmitatis]|uniref:(2Fe-2S)-binding protein n=1 Tax=Alteraurantiacibacter palmitatis TaxID=2054628 RepID=A0ABV7E6U8_9SPHN